MEHFVVTLALVGIVIVVASLLSGVLDRTGIPLVAVFLLLGAALGPYGIGVADITLQSPVLQVIATLGLALVLFSDAVTLETAAVRSRWKLAWRLLVPGTLLPAAIIAVAAWWLLDVPGPAAAILGAALASTDPVILRTLLRSRALPPTARIALRLETGMNDVVLLPIVVLAILALHDRGVPGAGEHAEIGRSLVGLFLLGPALGALVGWLGIVILVRVRGKVGVRRDYESLYALGLAFTGYAVAEAVGGSGFLAAFAAGMMVALQDVELCDCFLEYGEATAEMFLLLTFVAFGTSLIWTGVSVIDGPTLAFALIALSVRTIVLYPILGGLQVERADRRLIALFGPRGLSSLLLVLLPVFAGVSGADRLLTITCLVVLLSVLLHGSGISLYLRAHAPPARAGPVTIPTPAQPLPVVPLPAPSPNARADVPEHDDAARITLTEVRQLQEAGTPPVIVDVRSERSYMLDNLEAAGAVRLPPEDPVPAAEELRLPRDATIALYCA